MVLLEFLARFRWRFWSFWNTPEGIWLNPQPVPKERVNWKNRSLANTLCRILVYLCPDWCGPSYQLLGLPYASRCPAGVRRGGELDGRTKHMLRELISVTTLKALSGQEARFLNNSCPWFREKLCKPFCPASECPEGILRRTRTAVEQQPFKCVFARSKSL